MSDNTDTLESLASVIHEFNQRGWCVGTSGNFSALLSSEPFRLAISQSGVDKGRIRSDQFLTLDKSGELVEGQGKPSAETGLHYAIIASRGSRSILHVHSVWNTILSNLTLENGGFFLEGFEMLKGLSGISTHQTKVRIPVLENSQDIPALSEQVTKLLKGDAAVQTFLLAGHGMYTWGETLEDAKRQVEVLEFLFEVVGRQVLSTQARIPGYSL